MEKLLVIVGSAKCGTSSLHALLARHPSFSPGREKEPKFFTDFHGRSWQGPGIPMFLKSLIPYGDWEAYRANFATLGPGQWAIDASTDYIWCDASLDLLRRASETMDVRVVSIVRDPLARAISEYNHTLRGGRWETLSFAEALDAEERRMAEGYHPLFYHKRRSTVQRDVRRYHEAFGDRFLLLDYAQLRDTESVLKQICAFTGEPYIPVELSEDRNVTKLPRNRFVSRMLKSGIMRQLGHYTVPPPLRHRVWRALHTNSRNLITVSESEAELFRTTMAEEIAACRADPILPTAHWQLSLAKAA